MAEQFSLGLWLKFSLFLKFISVFPPLLSLYSLTLCVDWVRKAWKKSLMPSVAAVSGHMECHSASSNKQNYFMQERTMESSPWQMGCWEVDSSTPILPPIKCWFTCLCPIQLCHWILLLGLWWTCSQCFGINAFGAHITESFVIKQCQENKEWEFFSIINLWLVGMFYFSL